MHAVSLLEGGTFSPDTIVTGYGFGVNLSKTRFLAVGMANESLRGVFENEYI